MTREEASESAMNLNIMIQATLPRLEGLYSIESARMIELEDLPMAFDILFNFQNSIEKIQNLVGHSQEQIDALNRGLLNLPEEEK